MKKYLDRKRYAARDVEMARVEAGGEVGVSGDVEERVRGFVDVLLR